MTMITPEITRKIKTELQKAFAGYKFLVQKRHCNSINVYLIEGDIDFAEYDNNRLPQVCWGDCASDNLKRAWEFYEKAASIIDAILPQRIINVCSDYGSIPNYYLSISHGKWDKPYKLMAA